jgi:hypothetical protein
LVLIECAVDEGTIYRLEVHDQLTKFLAD